MYYNTVYSQYKLQQIPFYKENLLNLILFIVCLFPRPINQDSTAPNLTALHYHSITLHGHALALDFLCSIIAISLHLS